MECELLPYVFCQFQAVYILQITNEIEMRTTFVISETDRVNENDTDTERRRERKRETEKEVNTNYVSGMLPSKFLYSAYRMKCFKIRSCDSRPYIAVQETGPEYIQ